VWEKQDHMVDPASLPLNAMMPTLKTIAG
jgi:hypothetical protein